MERVFKRRSDQEWWHWRPECGMWLAVPMWKARGKTIVYMTLAELRPNTHRLCPGCTALDKRIRTRSWKYFTPVVPVRPGTVTSSGSNVIPYNPWGVS
jgi:hypothetical protein